MVYCFCNKRKDNKDLLKECLKTQKNKTHLSPLSPSYQSLQMQLVAWAKGTETRTELEQKQEGDS